MSAITEAAERVLSHIECYLGQMSDAAYSRPLALLSDASIGSHTRHILDGYLCLIRQEAGGVINYDHRERDLETERSTMTAMAVIANIRRYLQGLNRNSTFNLEVDYGTVPHRSDSSLERELIHNIEHTIHHLAIIKIGLLAYHDKVEIPPDFGVAPSTIRYRDRKNVKAAG